MSKRAKETKIRFRESSKPGGLARYANTFLITLITPLMMVGALYLAVFFILNSSYGPKILHGQLSQFLRGDYWADTMSTDAFLQTLTMTNVRLAEAGDPSGHVVLAQKLEAKIPIVELFDLVTGTLKIGRIKAYHADVDLDFSKGELNILKVVLPYFSKPEPPDPTPSGFTVFLSDLNVEHTDVHLIFDGFRIDLFDVDVDNYAIRIGDILEMVSPPSSEHGKPAIRVPRGILTFNPALFSFPLASRGDAETGLVMDGGTGATGATGYAWNQSAIYLNEILGSQPGFEEITGPKPNIRGNYIIPINNTLVDGFKWKGDRFDIPEMTTGVGQGGSIHMVQAMMNVAPTQKDIDEAALKYSHKPSGLLPEESILWAATVDVSLSVEDNVLTYFTGPVLHGKEQFSLRAKMAGDLARVSGDVFLDVPNFETFDIDVHRATLRGHMDGQNFDVLGFEADTMLGGLIAQGYYEIMDGNFNFDLYAGKAPDAGTYYYINPEFESRIKEGLSPLDFLPDGQVKRFGGLMSAHLQAESRDGKIAISLPETLHYRLDEEFAGIEKLEIRPQSTDKKPIFTYYNGIMESPGGLHVSTGKDYVQLKPGLRFDPNEPGKMNATVGAHIEQPEIYASALGFQDLSVGPINAEVGYQPCGKEPCGQIKLATQDFSYMGVDVPIIDVSMSMENASLKTEKFLIQTEFATIAANIQSDQMTYKKIKDPTNLPFHADIEVKDLDLENIHLDAIEQLNLDLKGTGEAEITLDGTVEKLSALLVTTLNDVEIMGESFSRMRLRARYEDDQIYVPMLNIWFDPAELDPEVAQKLEAEYQENLAKLDLKEDDPRPRRPYVLERGGASYRTADLAINTLTYDPGENTASFNIVLQPTSPSRFKHFKELDIPVDGELSFDISGNADLNLIASGFNAQTMRKIIPTWLEGDLKLHNLKYGDMVLGDSEIQLSRSQQFSLVKGNILDLMELSGFVRTSPSFSVSMTLNFADLDILQTLEQFEFEADDLRTVMNMGSANASGSIGFCMKGSDNMTVSLVLDDLNVDTFGNRLSLTQPAYFNVDLIKESLTLRQLEFRYRESVLKVSGTVDTRGNIDADLNGEIDAAMARSIVPSITDSTGLFGLSLSARGNFLYQNRFRLKNVNLSGYLGVRDPITVSTAIADAPIQLERGFVVVEKGGTYCPGNITCMYTPPDQPFRLGVNGEFVELKLSANTQGAIDVALDGRIQAAVAGAFVKEISDAQGSIDVHAAVRGNLLNSKYQIDWGQLTYEAGISVFEPVNIELRSFAEGFTLEDGIIQIASGADCPSKKECLVIPKSRPLKGNLLGGNYLIFGEIVRNNIIPKSGNLSFTASNVSFRMKDELALTLSPDIQILAKDFSDFDTITVSGNLDIGEARYKKNFDDGSSNFIRDQIVSTFIDSRRRVETYSPSFLRKMPQVGKIHLDIEATSENNISADVKIAGASLALEVGTQLRIGGTVKEFYPTGIVSVSSGVFSLRNNDFEFQNGAQIAFNGSLDGKIDIVATTEINTDSNAFSSVTGTTDLDRRKRISTSHSTSSDLYAVTLTVGGTVFKPVWSFESSPYLTDTNVYALILTGHTIEDFSGNDIAIETILSPFFSSQIDAFIKADQFKFVFSEGAAQFVYVKQINKGLRIAAGVAIRGSEGNEQALSAEYYFNDNLFVDLTGQNTSDEKGRAPTFKLGARIHWHLLLE